MRWKWQPWAIVAVSACFASVQATSAANAPDWHGATQVDVELSNFDFTPKRLVLRRDQPYRLRLTNRGSSGHDFSAPAFFKAAIVATEDAAAVVKGRIDVKKGETRVVRIVPRAGRYKLKCTHFMHAAFGMKGEIIVEW